MKKLLFFILVICVAGMLFVGCAPSTPTYEDELPQYVTQVDVEYSEIGDFSRLFDRENNILCYGFMDELICYYLGNMSVTYGE